VVLRKKVVTSWSIRKPLRLSHATALPAIALIVASTGDALASKTNRPAVAAHSLTAAKDVDTEG
jgi:hypothetical protein